VDVVGRTCIPDGRLRFVLQPFTQRQTSLDLPIPGSPEMRATCPPPSFACRQRESTSSSSSPRPIRGVSRVPCSAANRLSAWPSPRACHACTGSGKPLSADGVSFVSSNRSPSRRRVASDRTTAPASARSCSRAARFGVSPAIPRSCDSPEPIRSPTTTNPVAIPMRALSGSPTAVLSLPILLTSSKPALTARSASSSCACGYPK